MKKNLMVLCTALALVACKGAASSSEGNIADFTVRDANGQSVSLNQYKGHVVARFEPTADMAEVSKAVAALL